QQRCLGCHNTAKKRGGLDLSTRATALRGGDSGPALVPGAAGKSLLIQAVSGPRARMPRAGAKLSAAEVAALTRWVDAGAGWPIGVTLRPTGPAPVEGVWWSFRPLVRPPLPPVRDRAWGRTPIDAFILAALESKGLAPSAEADRRTLIRRLTFDLHGLP